MKTSVAKFKALGKLSWERSEAGLDMIKKVVKLSKNIICWKKASEWLWLSPAGLIPQRFWQFLASIAQELDLSLIVAHFNHGLRGAESDEDEKFCRDLSDRMGLVFCAAKMDQNNNKKGVSPEDFYRRERYGFLNKVAADYQARKIALGHNLQDQAETVLLNLLRGSGPEGLKGILPKRDGNIIRPLIEISRREIISYLNKAGISYRQDSSNKNKMYLRNQIRTELIPHLKEKYNPKIEENLAQMAEILRAEDEFIRQYTAQALQSSFIQRQQNSVLLKIAYINKLPAAIRLRLFKTILEDFSPAKNGFSFIHIKSLDNLSLKCESGKKLFFLWGLK